MIDHVDVLILDTGSEVSPLPHDALTAAGCGVRVVKDVGAALAALQTDAPDLLLLDGTGHLDLAEACRALNPASSAAAIPILLVGPSDTDVSLNRALEAGASDVLRAPFTSALLLARVRILLALARAQSAHRASSALLANMGHEIRSTMPAVLGLSHLALQSGLNARQRHHVELAARSGELLLDTLNDLLDFSALGAGQLQLRRATFALDDVLDSVAKLVALKAEAKGLELLWELPADLPSMLLGDAGRLRRVLVDLGLRAVRGAARGEIVIGIQRTAPDDAGAHLRFSVRDTGDVLGADAAAAPAGAAVDPALQLGHDISAHLIGLMGSSLEVQRSPSGVGTFAFGARFELPAQAIRVPPLVAGTGRVLVVEDNARARELLGALCGSLGLAIEAVADGWDALRQVDTARRAGQPYGLVLLDATMPAMDGMECVRLLRRGAACPPIALMVGTLAHDEYAERAAAESPPLAALLTKPIRPATLRALALGISLLRQVPVPAPPGAADVAPLGRAPHGAEAALGARARREQLRGVRVLLVDDNHIIQELALELLRGAGMQVVTATNGREAIERVAAQPFELILMDCQMPVMDGFDATRAIRAQPQHARLPIIALTAGLADADRERVIRSGMNDIVPKPIDVDQMFATLAHWLHADTEAPAPPAPSSLDPLSQLPGIDARIGRASTMNNDVLFRRLLGMFRDGQRSFPTQFRASRSAGDNVTATRLVHNLRAVSGSLGAVAVQHAALTLEGACTVNANDQAITDLLDAVVVELEPVLAGLTQLAP